MYLMPRYLGLLKMRANEVALMELLISQLATG